MSYQCEITEARELGDNYLLLSFKTPTDFQFIPGQHVGIDFLDQAGAFTRFYTIANAPNKQNEIQFCIMMSETRSRVFLRQMKVGQLQKISPARGTFKIVDPDRPAVLIAGGSGISPMRSFFQQLTANFTAAPRYPLHLVYGCRNADNFPGKEEFLSYRKKFNNNIEMWLTADRSNRSDVLSGSVTDHLSKAVIPGAHYYMCGPLNMMDAVRSNLKSHNIDAASIFNEVFVMP